VSEPEPERTAVYRVRGEADELLYIGMTNGPAVRWNSHQLVQPWWDELRTLTVQWHDSRPEAAETEKLAIFAEQPKYNLTYLKPAGLGRERTPPEVLPVEHGKAELGPRDDDENLLTLDEVGEMTRMGPTVLRRTFMQMEGPSGFVLGRQTIYRRREIRQWIADIEASQREAAA
jgi:predicted DNA-binding transcriptional regulator AlpA